MKRQVVREPLGFQKLVNSWPKTSRKSPKGNQFCVRLASRKEPQRPDIRQPPAATGAGGGACRTGPEKPRALAASLMGLDNLMCICACVCVLVYIYIYIHMYVQMYITHVDYTCRLHVYMYIERGKDRLSNKHQHQYLRYI